MGEGILIFLEGDVTVISYINKPRFLPSSRPSMAQPLHRIGQQYPWTVFARQVLVDQEDRCFVNRIGYPGYWENQPQLAFVNLGGPFCFQRRGRRKVGWGRERLVRAAWISPQSFASPLCGAIHWTTQRPSCWW